MPLAVLPHTPRSYPDFATAHCQSSFKHCPRLLTHSHTNLSPRSPHIRGLPSPDPSLCTHASLFSTMYRSHFCSVRVRIRRQSRRGLYPHQDKFPLPSQDVAEKTDESMAIAIRSPPFARWGVRYSTIVDLSRTPTMPSCYHASSLYSSIDEYRGNF